VLWFRGTEYGVITFLGMVVFMAIVAIGALDGRSGLGLFAMYRSMSVTSIGRPARRRRGRRNRPGEDGT
jgi:hypothetical protein